MNITSFTFNPFSTNCYVIESGEEIAVVDPSNQSREEHDELIGFIRSRPGLLTRVLLTHAHIDHIFGCAALFEAFGVAPELHATEQILLERGAFQAQLFGTELAEPPSPAGFIEPGGTLRIGVDEFEVLHTPGHSPGSVTLVHRGDNVAIAGDVLFAGSIGRTDLWQGSMPTLMESIFQQLVPLGDDMRILPGHGPETTIGEEKRSNPFLLGEGAPL